MGEYKSVDLLFHFDVDANSPSEARKQADLQFRMGCVGASICNREDKGIITTIDPDEILKCKAIQELAKATKICIVDTGSLERAISLLLPSKVKAVVDVLESEAYNPKNEIEFQFALDEFQTVLDEYNQTLDMENNEDIDR